MKIKDEKKTMIKRSHEKKKTSASGQIDASCNDHDVGSYHSFDGLSFMVMDIQTDRPSHRDARTHLQTKKFYLLTTTEKKTGILIL